MRSRLAFFFCAVLLVYGAFGFNPRWKHGGSQVPISWDVAGYYWYLPSLFIYQDLRHQRFDDSVSKQYGMSGGSSHTRPYGHGRVLQYSCGMTVLYSPFFFAAHALAKPLGFPADGFSRPYQFAIALGSVLVAILGLGLYRRFLLRYFSDGVVALTLLVLGVGSNYLNYSSTDGAMSHTWLFTIYAALLLATRQFYEGPSVRRAALIGLLVGLAALVRPTDVISALIPLLWGVEGISADSIRERLRFFTQHRAALGVAALLAAAIMSLQAVYWKYTTGHWLVYSYGDQGFTFLPPHAFDYTFSYRSGWLMYTPMLAFAAVGVIPFLRRGPNRVMAVVFAGAAFWLVTAWDIWWYAGSGGRAMIQYYPVLFLFVASLLEALAKTRWVKWMVLPLFLFCTYINFWWTWHAHRGSLYDAENGMTRAYYWRVIGRWNAPVEVAKLKDTDELYPGSPQQMTELPAFTQAFGADSVYDLGALEGFDRRLPANVVPQGARWLRLSARFRAPQKEWTVWMMGQMGIRFSRGEETVHERIIRVHRFLSDGDERTLFIDVRIPEESFTEVRALFYQPSKKPLLIDHIRVFALR